MLTANGPLKNIVVINNGLIDSLVAREDFQQAFPHLAKLVKPRPVRPGCRPCLKKQKATLAEYRNVKNAMAIMGPEDKVRLKQFLDCKQVRVVHVNGANRIYDRTF